MSMNDAPSCWRYSIPQLCISSGKIFWKSVSSYFEFLGTNVFRYQCISLFLVYSNPGGVVAQPTQQLAPIAPIWTTVPSHKLTLQRHVYPHIDVHRLQNCALSHCSNTSACCSSAHLASLKLQGTVKASQSSTKQGLHDDCQLTQYVDMTLCLQGHGEGQGLEISIISSLYWQWEASSFTRVLLLASIIISLSFNQSQVSHGGALHRGCLEP